MKCFELRVEIIIDFVDLLVKFGGLCKICFVYFDCEGGRLFREIKC